MLALIALLLCVPLLYLPGWLLARALTGSAEAPDTLERIFERVLLGALLNGWLVLLLAELGVFSIWAHLLLLILICVLAYYRSATMPPIQLWGKTRRQGDKATRRQGDSATIDSPVLPLSMSPGLPLRSLWSPALVGILLLFTVLVAARPFEVVLGVRDAGVYANTGFAIARTGGIAQLDAIVAEIEADQLSTDPGLRDAAAQAETNLLGVQSRERTIATRLRQAGFFIHEGDMAAGRVVPQGFHLFPAWIALLASLAGAAGGLAATGLLGLLGLWSVAMLGRRLAGPWVGVASALLLATNGPQIWFSRYSTAETIAQFLTFAGLYAFAAMIGREADSMQGKRLPALLCGLAIGQLALARIDFFLVVAPLVAYLFLTWLFRRWQTIHSWLGLSLLAMLLHAGIHIATIARAYFFDTVFARLQDYAITALVALPFLTPALRERFLLRPCSPIAIQPCPPVAGMPPTTFTDWNYARIATECVLLLLAIVALLALRRWGQPLLLYGETLLKRQQRWVRLGSALMIGLLGMYGFLVRPQILTPSTLTALPSCLSPAALRVPQGACLILQGYIGAPIDSPAYANPLMAWVGGLTQQLRGRAAPSLEACVALRNGMLPATANGLTSVELRAAGLVSEPQIGKTAWDTLQACDRFVLRDLIANSQANLVRVGWYLSPLGVLIALVGLALWWWRMRSDSWPFLVVALVATFFFVRLTYGTSDQHFIYILRRYVPQVYPALCLGIAYFLGLGMARWQHWAIRIGRIVLLGALVCFNLGTNLKILTHTEYAGALEQISAIASQFDRRDILLMRGGAPDFGSARDIPDNLATPLTYAYGLNALTIKSAQPGKYAGQLATYIERWRAEGREVYLLAGASGAVGLPGLALEPVERVEISLPEFEQPTRQKPTNVQNYQLDVQIYRIVADTGAVAATTITPDAYAAQVAGFYRAELLEGKRQAWTNGTALLRIARPTHATTLTIRLSPGATRPARLGAPQVCLAYRAEPSFWVEDPAAPAFSQPICQPLGVADQELRILIDPATLPVSRTLLIRIQSDTWIPARDDPAQNDGRRLGVLFAGAQLR